METFTLTLPAFAVLALAAPLVLGGEQVVERVGWLRRLSVPASVIGGLFAAPCPLGDQRQRAGRGHPRFPNRRSRLVVVGDN